MLLGLWLVESSLWVVAVEMIHKLAKPTPERSSYTDEILVLGYHRIKDNKDGWRNGSALLSGFVIGKGSGFESQLVRLFAVLERGFKSKHVFIF